MKNHLLAWALPILVLPSFVTSTQAAAVQTRQHISAVAYGCSFNGVTKVTISMQNRFLFKGDEGVLQVLANPTEDGGLRVDFDVPSGPIDIAFWTEYRKCMNGGGGIIVLPGHDRHFLVAMQPGLFVTDWHGRKFFAGTMPSVPVSVSVVSSDSGDCPDENSPERAATIDGNAYYVGYAYGKHMFLKLRSAFETLYIALPDAVPVESNNQYVRRDITDDDLKLLSTHALNQAVQCVKSPSGTSMRFDP